MTPIPGLLRPGRAQHNQFIDWLSLINKVLHQASLHVNFQGTDWVDYCPKLRRISLLFRIKIRFRIGLNLSGKTTSSGCVMHYLGWFGASWKMASHQIKTAPLGELEFLIKVLFSDIFGNRYSAYSRFKILGIDFFYGAVF